MDGSDWYNDPLARKTLMDATHVATAAKLFASQAYAATQHIADFNQDAEGTYTVC